MQESGPKSKKIPRFSKMTEPARHLHAVDPTTGEIIDCPGCLARDDEIAGLQTELRGWRTRYANLKRDKDAEAQSRQLLGQGGGPLARMAHRHRPGQVPSGQATASGSASPSCERTASTSAGGRSGGSPMSPTRKTLPSGLVETYRDWELCFRNRATFERYARRGCANPRRANNSLSARKASAPARNRRRRGTVT